MDIWKTEGFEVPTDPESIVSLQVPNGSVLLGIGCNPDSTLYLTFAVPPHITMQTQHFVVVRIGDSVKSDHPLVEYRYLGDFRRESPSMDFDVVCQTDDDHLFLFQQITKSAIITPGK